MGSQAGPAPKSAAGRGFVVGDLLVGALLLAAAISSITALMYYVTRNTRTPTPVECTAGGAGDTSKCVAEKGASTVSSTPRATGCATRKGVRGKACADSAASVRAVDATPVGSLTDPASLEALPNRQVKRTKRPDLGFIR